MRTSASIAIAIFVVACKPASGDASASSPSASPPASVAPATSTQAPAAHPVTPGATAEIGKPAPDFTLADLDGKTVRLSEYADKIVVLEWFNPECPFVKRNHTQGPLKTMAKEQMAKGIVWLSINSGAPGKQGAGVEKSRDGRDRYAMTNPILIDTSGEVGHAYGARTTPGMYVVSKGVLVYRGAIDNAQDGDPPGGEKLINYVDAALADVAAGRAVAVPETKSYGCSVKYGS
jgi:hypothetical protein